MVIVVRHAERAAEPGNDPALSPAGRDRAVLLAQALANARVTAIITTPLRRAKETAQPLAEKIGIQPLAIGFRKGEFAAHVPEVVAALKKMSGTVLVVGHANTTPEIVTALTGEPLPQFCETSFSHVFVVEMATKSFALLGYGAPDTPPAEGCQ